MKYFFVLGRQPEISLAEITAILESGRYRYQIENYSASVCIVDINQAIDVDFLISELGGTIKIGRVEKTIEIAGQANLKKQIEEAVLDLAEIKLSGQEEKKLFFGLSGYKIFEKKSLMALGLDIKKQLSGLKIKARLVTSRDEALSSVVVKTNKLLSGRGLEILLAGNGQVVWLAQTLAIQPFDEYEARDYGRPGRDAYSGMLPPKLAKIMINLAQADKNSVLLDPFCGSGTILTEAALMGYKNLMGSDISASAVTQTKENLEWTTNKSQISNLKSQILLCDCRKLSGCYKPESVDMVVTEPYLGPPLSGRELPAKIEKNIQELAALYLVGLKEISKVIKPGGTALMVWPVFRKVTTGGDKFLLILNQLEQFGFKKESLLPEVYKNLLTPRGTLVYARPDQRVGREIIKLKKIS